MDVISSICLLLHCVCNAVLIVPSLRIVLRHERNKDTVCPRVCAQLSPIGILLNLIDLSAKLR